MFFRIAADGVLLLHLAFILFALLGAAMTVRCRWIPIVHIPLDRAYPFGHALFQADRWLYWALGQAFPRSRL